MWSKNYWANGERGFSENVWLEAFSDPQILFRGVNSPPTENAQNE
jgi:hypothetical protein